MSLNAPDTVPEPAVIQKRALREEIKTFLKKIPKEEFTRKGKDAAGILRSSPVWLRHTAVFLFLSMNLEIDTQPLLEAALEDGKKVFVPKVEGEKLIFCRVLSAGGPWRDGPFGIREPHDKAPAGAEDFPALIITPGLAFDRNGNRLGKGKGFYDRYFEELDKKNRQYTALGLCMDSQLLQKVPAEERDKRVEWITAGNTCFAVNPKS